MRLFEDFYVYPWLSYEANNCNTIFIDGEVPTLIDPGHIQLFKHAVEGMMRDGKSPDNVKLIIATHGHPDHMEALQLFDTDVLKAIGKTEAEYLINGGKELYLMTGCQMPSKPFQISLKEGILKLGNKTLRIIDTPGHSPGSICIYWEEEKVLISGDTVFYMGVGRTDLPGGDAETLSRSIQKIASLECNYLIPGHGEMLKGSDGIGKNFTAILNDFFGISHRWDH